MVRGDVVLFKTGGPRMTIMKINKKNMATCAFFIGDALNSVKVPIESIEKVTGVTYDENESISDLAGATQFNKTVQYRDETDIENITDDTTLIVLEKYIKEDQPKILAKLEGRELSIEPEEAIDGQA